MKLKLKLFIPLFCMAFFVQGQETIEIRNPSLEDVTKSGQVNGFGPREWLDCSHPDQSSVDIQPWQFGVALAPTNGKSYVGMVTRKSETWEGISQKLSAPILKGQKYEITVYLARSNYYLSPTRKTKKPINFANALQLRLYGSNGYCGKSELLARSPMIDHDDWKSYTLAFEAQEEFTYILLEGFYQTPSLAPYNGNILLDNLSDIQPISEFTDKHITLDSELLKRKVEISNDTLTYEKPLITPVETKKGNALKKPSDGIIPERIKQKKYIPPTKQRRFKPKESKPQSQYIPRPIKQSATKKEIVDAYLTGLNIKPDEFPEKKRATVHLILAFTEATEKSGWVNYMEKNTFDLNNNLTQKLNEIRATEAAEFLQDYNNTKKLNDLEKKHEREKLLRTDPRKAAIFKIPFHLETFAKTQMTED